MNPDHLSSLLKDLIALPSINPSYGGTGEAAVANFVEDFLRQAGLEPSRQEVFPGRDNIIARVGPAGPALLLDAHMDTVAAEGWFSGSPFEPIVKEGRIYGRGACDTKASLAVFLAITAHFARQPEKLKHPLVFAATIDEEEKQTGALRLAEAGLDLKAAITGEPTCLDIIHAHKGVLRFQIRTTGTAAHSAFPERGENAILRMAQVLIRLTTWQKELSHRPKHPTLGNPTGNVGTIRGGNAVNIVPDHCTIDIDRRLLPGETGAEVQAELRQLLHDIPGVSIETPYLERSGIDTPIDAPFSQELAAAIRPTKPDVAFHTAPYMTNATAYVAAGVPSLVFGPGDIAQAHTRDEFVETAQLGDAFRVLLELLGDRV